MTPEQTISKLKAQWKDISNREGIDFDDVADYILDCPKFYIWSASAHPNTHHYGKHGLLVHTNEVIDLMLAAKTTLALKTPDHYIFLSALYHDYGKLWDYERDDSIDKKVRVGDWYEPEYAEWRSAQHKTLIHHISRSNLVWNAQAADAGLDEHMIDEVSHAILAHHGHKEWGSPVTPLTELAWLLHTADLASARLNDWNRK